MTQRIVLISLLIGVLALSSCQPPKPNRFHQAYALSRLGHAVLFPDGTVKSYDLENQPFQQLNVGNQEVVMGADGRHLIASGSPGPTEAYDLVSGKKVFVSGLQVGKVLAGTVVEDELVIVTSEGKGYRLDPQGRGSAVVQWSTGLALASASVSRSGEEATFPAEGVGVEVVQWKDGSRNVMQQLVVSGGIQKQALGEKVLAVVDTMGRVLVFRRDGALGLFGPTPLTYDGTGEVRQVGITESIVWVVRENGTGEIYQLDRKGGIQEACAKVMLDGGIDSFVVGGNSKVFGVLPSGVGAQFTLDQNCFEQKYNMGSGHQHLVNQAVFVGSQWIATASEDGTVGVWDKETGKLVRRIVVNGDGVTSIDTIVLPSGKALLMAGERNNEIDDFSSRTVKLWDMDDLDKGGVVTTPYRELPQQNSTSSVASCREGRKIVTTDKYGAKLWNLDNGSMMEFVGDVSGGVACSPNGKFIWIGGGLVATLWNTDRRTSRLFTHSMDKDQTIKSVALLSDELGEVTHMMTGGGPIAKVWNLAQNSSVLLFAPAGRSIRSVAFSPDGKHVIAGALTSVTLWEVNGIQVGTIDVGSLVNSVSFSANGDQVLVSGGNDATLWNTTQFKSGASRTPVQTYQSELKNSGGATLVSGVTWSNDHEIALYLIGKEAVLWNVEQAKVVGHLVHSSKVERSAWSPTGNRIAVALDDKTLVVWKKEGTTWRQEQVISHDDIVRSIAFSAEGDRMLSVDKKKVREFVYLNTAWAEEKSWSGKDLWFAAWSPSRRLVFVFDFEGAHFDTTLLDWSASTPVSLKQIRLFTYADAAFSSDERMIVMPGFWSSLVVKLDDLAVEKRFPAARAMIWLPGEKHVASFFGGSLTIRSLDQPSIPIATTPTNRVSRDAFSVEKGALYAASYSGVSLAWSFFSTVRQATLFPLQ